MRNKHQAIVGHFLSLLNLYANQIVDIMIGMILSEIIIFRCFYISNWSQMMALDEDFVTIICIEINCILLCYLLLSILEHNSIWWTTSIKLQEIYLA